MDISNLNIFSFESVAIKYFLSTGVHERAHLAYHSIGIAMKQLWDFNTEAERYEEELGAS